MPLEERMSNYLSGNGFLSAKQFVETTFLNVFQQSGCNVHVRIQSSFTCSQLWQLSNCDFKLCRIRRCITGNYIGLMRFRDDGQLTVVKYRSCR